MSLKYTHATAQGKRYYQEDRWVIREFPKGTLFAVIDGHGGFTCADKVRQLLPDYWAAFDSDEMNEDPEARILKVFDSLNINTANQSTGCTVSLAYIPKDEKTIHVGILGDSPVYIQSGGSLHISPEHNVRSNPSERKFAESKGAIYHRGYIWDNLGDYGSGLQMSRTLGDKQLDYFLNRVPEIYTVNLVPDCYVVLSTDGLVDPSHGLSILNCEDSSDLTSMLNLVNEGKIAQDLVNLALERETGDNVTAILIHVRKD